MTTKTLAVDYSRPRPWHVDKSFKKPDSDDAWGVALGVVLGAVASLVILLGLDLLVLDGMGMHGGADGNALAGAPYVWTGLTGGVSTGLFAWWGLFLGPKVYPHKQFNTELGRSAYCIYHHQTEHVRELVQDAYDVVMQYDKEWEYASEEKYRINNMWEDTLNIAITRERLLRPAFDTGALQSAEDKLALIKESVQELKA